jgi:protocatechuate 3,4-dioxygenase, alpha subunit
LSKPPLTLTPSQTVGPFFHLGLTGSRSVGRIAGPGINGQRIRLTCRVLDNDGVPVNDALVEIWQADAQGHYHHPDDPCSPSGHPVFLGFGRQETDKDGSCSFETIKPGRVPASHNHLQAPHLNCTVFARGLLKHLTTRLYFSGDPANSEDPILRLVPQERRDTLMAHEHPAQRGTWHINIHLSGESETVFFDV